MVRKGQDSGYPDFASWKIQWGRVKRYYDRVFKLARGKLAPNNELHELDDTYSFFLHCYHLKDWLKNDPAFARDNEEIEDFVTRTASLSLCADIANSVKHLELDRKPRSGSRPGDVYGNFGMERFETFGGVEKEFTKAVLYIRHKGAPKPVVRIAHHAVCAWEEFLKESNSSPTAS